MTKHRTAKEILASETQRNQPVQHREFLTANQWLKKTFPEIEEAGRQSISQGQYDALTKGYDNYFATQMAIANQSILQSSNGGSQGRGLGGLVIPPEVLERARAAMVRGDFADKNVTFVLRAYGIPPGIDDRAIKAEHRNENPFHTPK